MSVSHKYQDFGSPVVEIPETQTTQIPLEAIEDQKLESFENGYKAGWDDAVRANDQIKKTVSEAFAQSMREASYSYDEARLDLATELRSIIEPLLKGLLPKIAHDALGAHIVEQFNELITTVQDKPLEVAVAPQQKNALAVILETQFEEPCNLVEDDTLGPDQVFIRVGAQEREINFDTWLSDVGEAVTAYFDKAVKESTVV